MPFSAGRVVAGGSSVDASRLIQSDARALGKLYRRDLTVLTLLTSLSKNQVPPT